MGLLDFIDPPAPYKPPVKTGKYERESLEQQEARDKELNNFNRTEVTEDFSDSPFADRI